jgi:uncharacterized membrane protein
LSDLLVIEFPGEAKAEGVREILLAMHKEYLIEPADTIIAVAEDSGPPVKLNQLLQPVAQREKSGMPWGSLICLLFMMPRAGAAIDAASPAFEQRLADLGISEDFARQAARTLRSGNATLFLLIRQKATDKVLAGLSGAGGMVMRSAFDETKEEALRGAHAATRATTS